MEPKVSIIVPIYGTERYLAQCVDSLLAQTLTDIEIILVDDGSPDNSGAIADAYARQDRRVRVIHQNNAGLGPARNAGMEAAAGEYLGFVDSDDWVCPEMFRRLYEAAGRENADIAVSGHRDMAGDRILVSKVHPLAGRTLTSEEELRSVRRQLFGHAPWDKEAEAFPMSVCMSLYRKEMVNTHALRFREIMSEDTIFNLDAYACANVMVFTDGTDYCYRKENQASITQSFSHHKGQRFLRFLQTLAQMAEQEDGECVLRSKRMAIDYCRLYVGQVAGSNLSFREKKREVRLFVRQEGMKDCWDGYPIKTLPAQQRIFQEMILHGRYGAALMLHRLRHCMRKGAETSDTGT